MNFVTQDMDGIGLSFEYLNISTVSIQQIQPINLDLAALEVQKLHNILEIQEQSSFF